ncbi:MAG: hypothetical protein WCJ01_10260, partial [Ignavibacteria bacterium]
VPRGNVTGQSENSKYPVGVKAKLFPKQRIITGSFNGCVVLPAYIAFLWMPDCGGTLIPDIKRTDVNHSCVFSDILPQKI